MQQCCKHYQFGELNDDLVTTLLEVILRKLVLFVENALDIALLIAFPTVE